jgi:alkylation response protein AidB-like acyl-CoA dehydrogenase
MLLLIYRISFIIQGKDVYIPMSKIIGGQTRCGFGWNMLMDCLAEGRSEITQALLLEY